MKTKLFYLFIAVFLLSFSGKAQTYPIITLIGSGNGGWTDTAETPMLTSDGITYSLVDKVLTTGELKFREGKCWTSGCPGTVTNPYGWGPTDAQFAIDGGWPSGTNAAPVDGGKNIQSVAGVWTITFNRINGTWSFVPGTPLPVIKLVGTAVTAPGGAELTTADGIIFTAKKVTLVPGDCKFSIDGTVYGSAVSPGFPTGTADAPTGNITVTTTGIDYDVTFDYSTAAYTFAVATFPGISIVGDGTGVDGWPGQPGNPGPIDVHQMSTTDGVTYTLNNLPIVPGQLLFRTNNDWAVKYGDTPFPTGSGNGSNNIVVPAGNAGTYNVTLDVPSKTYTFTKITYSIVGDGAGGWPPFAGNDPNQLSTVDGVNYTLNGLVLTNGGAKFRLNNAWAGGDWGGDTFPSGTKTGNNIPTVAGTYNLAVNVLTGAYDFGTALAVNSFRAAAFKAYPNPTKNSWNITSNDDITSVKVFDILGKSVYAKTTSSKEVNVNASELSKGVYFAKISTANGTSTVKLIKE